MDALPAELIKPICALINPDSLSKLKGIPHANAQWSDSVDQALASRFNLSVNVKYSKTAGRNQLRLEKRFLNADSSTRWTPHESDPSYIEALVFHLKPCDPKPDSSDANLMTLAELCSMVSEALRLLKSSRKVDITIERLEDRKVDITIERLAEYPGDLLDLLPRKGPFTKVTVDTSRCPVIPPFDVPIRIHLHPFVGSHRSQYLKRLRGRECLRWLVEYWTSHSRRPWDSEISIPMVDGEIWESEVEEFEYKSSRYRKREGYDNLYVRYIYKDQAVKVIAITEPNFDHLHVLFSTVFTLLLIGFCYLVSCLMGWN
uniref:F-box domain-containing protein n=1 Tax=Steinernema glaseri TaxID=37863 RepID=A0A1I7ZTQ3_9BILA